MRATLTSLVASRCIGRRLALTTAPPRRADQLNAHLDDWREEKGTERSLDASRRFGTVDWWLETYCRSPAFEKLKARTKPSYRYQLGSSPMIKTRTGDRLGLLPAKSITPSAVDKIYEALRGGKDGTKLRRANHTIDIAKKAWAVVQRTHPHQFVQSNPFVGLTRFRSSRRSSMPRGLKPSP